MQKLMKKRMPAYLHPSGMTVRGYLGEHLASKQAYSTRPVAPTHSYQMDQIQKDAATRVALDALRGLATGIAPDLFANPNNGLNEAKKRRQHPL